MPARGPQHPKRPGYKQIGLWGWDDHRLWSKIKKTDDPNQCYLWQGSMSPTGALMGGWKAGVQQMSQARRFVYMSVTGEDVAPYRVTLTCANQRCCNFSHFEIKENNRKNKYD
jgi:hypothetical protein